MVSLFASCLYRLMRTAEAGTVNDKDGDIRPVKRGATWSAIIKRAPFPMDICVGERATPPPPLS